MKNCRGTINYVFSPHSLKVLRSLGLLGLSVDTKNPLPEAAGCLEQTLWLRGDTQNFAVEFRELINEDEFLPPSSPHALANLEPIFIGAENLSEPSLAPAENSFSLQGLLIEDNATARAKLESWQFPCEIFWTSASENSLSHQLSYKKKFPFWALLLKSNKPLGLPQGAPEVSWRGQKLFWIQLETTSWDLLIMEK